jgi:hypothetical protein
MSWCITGFLLIASAVQGITPDARDLCSSLAIEWLLAPTSNRADARDGEDQSDELCLADEQLSDRKAGPHQKNATGSAIGAWIGGPPVDAASVRADRLGAFGRITPGAQPFEGLSRLNC